MSSEGIIKEIDQLSMTDMIRVYQYIVEKYEKTKREHPNTFPNAKWAVNNPDKAKERNRIKSQQHRNKLKEKEEHNNLKI